jgi:hypothetical protein
MAVTPVNIIVKRSSMEVFVTSYYLLVGQIVSTIIQPEHAKKYHPKRFIDLILHTNFE